MQLAELVDVKTPVASLLWTVISHYGRICAVMCCPSLLEETEEELYLLKANNFTTFCSISNNI